MAGPEVSAALAQTTSRRKTDAVPIHSYDRTRSSADERASGFSEDVLSFNN